MSAKNVFGIVGWKNSGKTTLVEALVAEFVRQGLRVSTIKHAHHEFDIDVPGKDSHRHRMAGAKQVIVASHARWALMRELRGEPEPTLDELLAHLSPCDLVLVEGFKGGSHPKIEIVRQARFERRLADRDPMVVAIATNDPRLAAPHPSIPLDDVKRIAAFICDFCGIRLVRTATIASIPAHAIEAEKVG